MQKLLFITTFLIMLNQLHNIVVAQNLVPNPSFEDTISCPKGTGQVRNVAIGWNAINSADFFHSCYDDVVLAVDVPQNFFGYQCPANGNAYGGFYTTVAGVYNHREFLFTKLLSPLNIGQKYYVSFKVVASDFQDCYINKIGALFTNLSITDTIIIPPTPFINNISQVYTNNIVADTVNWIIIRGAFIADSAFEYVYLGTFFDETLLDTICKVPNPNPTTYYYIDDICISSDSLVCEITDSSNVCNPTNISEQVFLNKEPLVIYPNPTSNKMNIEIPMLNGKLNVYSSLGILVGNQELYKGNNYIECNYLTSGIYLLQIIIANNVFFRKVILTN